MSYPVWRLSLDKAALQAHRAWFDRGKSGPGRLVLEDQNLQGAKAPLNFPGARFVRCDLSSASLALFKLDELELVDCKLDDANLARTHFPGASIEGTTFRRADLRLAHFHHARIRDSDLGETKLDRGLFIGAVLERVSFAGAHLVDTVFDDARLVDCDLRGCDLSRVDPVLDLARTTRARFERCDLRGAKLDGRRIDGTVFDHCRMDGMTGKPEIRGPYTITAPEGSTVEDIESAWR